MAENQQAAEVERLLVRLVGDGSSYMRMTQQAAEAAKKTVQEVEGAAKRIEGFQKGLEGFAGGTLKILGILGVAGGLWASFEKFSQFEESQLRMKAAIDASGQAFDETKAKFDAYAETVAKTTLVNRASTRDMLRHATTLGLDAEHAKQAVTQSIALAGALGGEAEGYVAVAAALQRGDVHMIRRILHLHGVKDETEVLARAQKIMESGLAQQEARANTVSGSIEKLKISLFGLGIEVGKIVNDKIKPWIKGLQDVVEWYKKLSPEVKQTTVYVLAAMGAMIGLQPALSTIKYLLAPAVALLKGLWSILLLAVSPIGLFVAGIVALGAAWLMFTESGQEAAKWFTEQWGTMVKEVPEAIKGITDAIAGGDMALAFEIAWSQIQLVFFRSIRPIQEFWELFVFKMKLVFNNTVANIGYSLLAFKMLAAQTYYNLAMGWQLMVYGFKTLWANMIADIQISWLKATSYVESTWINMQHDLKLMSDDEFSKREKALIEGAGARATEIEKERNASIRAAAEAGVAAANDLNDRIHKAEAELAAKAAEVGKAAMEKNVEAGKEGIEAIAAIQKRIDDLTVMRAKAIADAAVKAKDAVVGKDKDKLELGPLASNLNKAAAATERIQANLRGSTGALQTLSDYADTLARGAPAITAATGPVAKVRGGRNPFAPGADLLPEIAGGPRRLDQGGLLGNFGLPGNIPAEKNKDIANGFLAFLQRQNDKETKKQLDDANAFLKTIADNIVNPPQIQAADLGSS